MALRFDCNRCPASFNQIKYLFKHYEDEHDPDDKKHRKLRDLITYSGSDSGCKAATEYLGYQSFCLECPFPKCILEEPGVGIARAKKRNRNEEIIKRFREGENISNLVKAFDVCRRTIERVIEKHRKDG